MKICEKSIRLALNRTGGMTGRLYKEYLEIYYHINGKICSHSKKDLIKFLRERAKYT